MKKNYNYTRALEFVVKQILASKEIKTNTKFIVVLGSYREKEIVQNYSDLDILLILNSDNYGTINVEILDDLRRIASIASKRYGVKISLLTHTIFDFEEYVDFNYLIHYSWGEVIYGDKKGFQSIFNRLLNKKQFDKKVRSLIIYYNIIHARFNLIRRFVSLNKTNTRKYKQEIVKIFIDNILEICDWFLVYNDIFVVKKSNIVRTFLSNFPYIYPAHIPKLAYNMRKKWNDLDFNRADTINYFLMDSIAFVHSVVAELYKLHVQK